jgi:hypothetical protein
MTDLTTLCEEFTKAMTKQRAVLITVSLCMFLAVAFIFPSMTWGQVSTASMNGAVHDSSGAVVPGAKMTVMQTEKQLRRETTTGSDGTFVFPALPVGPYTLEAEKEGFSLYRQTGIVLTVAEAASVSVTLQVGRVSETVIVSGEASMVNTTDSTLSRLIGEQQVEGLPLNGRQPAALVFLAAGSSDPTLNIPTSNTGNPTLQNSLVHPREIAPSINGVRGDGVYFSLDGANNVDSYQVTGGPFPNPDAVQEFRVVTSTYGAEYVSAPAGAVNIVTKSGTNEFHGDIWEFHRNGVLNARNYFADRHDDLKRNQFGAAAGGRILKDKLFLFGSYEGMRLRDVVRGLTAFVPTDAERSGDFSALPQALHDPATGTPYANNQIPVDQFNPVITGLLAFIPHSTAPGGKIQFARPVDQNDDQGVLRLDYVRGRHLLMGRYFVDEFDWAKVGIEDGNLLRSFRGQAHRWQNIALGDTYSRSSNFVNDFRISYVRDSSTTVAGESTVTLPGLGASGFPPGEFPTIQSLQVAGSFAIDPGNYNGFPREIFSLSEHVNVLRGRHEISFGADLQYLRAKLLTDNVQNPVSIYAGVFSGSPLSDFFLGRPFAFVQGDGIYVRARGKLYGFYGQDKIRMSTKLTATVGMRWDPYVPFTARSGRMACFRPGQQSKVFANAPNSLLFDGDPGCNSSGTNSNLSTFQPRIGLAYRLDDQGKTVIRSGYGLYTMQFPLFSFLGFGFSQPFSRIFFRFGSPDPISAPWASFPGGSPFANGFQLDDKPRPTDVSFISPVRVASFAPNLKLGYVQQWSLTLERSLAANTSVQASYVGTKGTHLSLGADENQAIYIPGMSNGGNIDQRRPFPGISQAVILRSAGNSVFHAFELELRHRIGGGLTVDSSFTAGKSIDYVSSNANPILTGSPNQIPDPANPAAYRGLSDFDISHSWRTSFVWQIPTPGKDRLLAKTLLSDWQVSGIFSLDAGQPFNVASLPDNSLTGNNLDYADRVPGVSPTLSTGRSHAALINEYFNTAAFTQNAIGTFGNSGRNPLRAPGFTNLDFGVSKAISFSERYRAVFRAEFFNLTNTPHFLPPNAQVGTSTFGQILGARDPRILQFGLKLFW